MLFKGKAEGDAHDFSSTQVNVPEPAAGIILEMAARISDEDLAEDGREETPHVTVQFGLSDDDPWDVREAMREQWPARLRFGQTSLFARPGVPYEVVKVDVESVDLQRLRERIRHHTETHDTHPAYEPHVTLAYVKVGTGHKYVGMADLDGVEVVVDTLMFSDKNRNLIPVPLGVTKVHVPTRLKAAKEAYWKRVFNKRLKPAEAEFARKYSSVVKAIQKDTVASGELRNLKRWKKRLADEFRTWYMDQLEDAQAAMAKDLGKEKAARLFTKAKRGASWDWADYEYGEVQRDGRVRLDLDRMVRDHLDVLTGTLDTMDERIERALEASPDGLTEEDISKLLDEEFDAILDNGHVDDIATTEASWAESNGRLAEMAERGIEWHEWATAGDERVRENHVTYGEQGAVPVGTNFAKFVGEEYLLRWPHDAECEEVGEVANCRCVPLPAVTPDDATDEEVADFLDESEADE